MFPIGCKVFIELTIRQALTAIIALGKASVPLYSIDL